MKKTGIRRSPMATLKIIDREGVYEDNIDEVECVTIDEDTNEQKTA